MSELQRSVLEFYQITTPYPEEWPETKNNASDASDDEDAKQRQAKLNRRKSRYQVLERTATNRSSTVPGSEKGNLVQRDEPDPLGSGESVVEMLKRSRAAGSISMTIQDDAQLRSRFLLSSTSFSPALFLSQVHTDDSTETLVAGLDAVSRSIDQKSASLKVLVESNFERFVRAKATIDNVYKEMKYRGVDPATAEAATTPRTRAHSRHASRNSFRSSMSAAGLAGGGLAGGLASALAGGAGVGTAVTGPEADSSRKRNALTKESEYGVLGIKQPLVEVSSKAEEVWGPALGGRAKEATLRKVSGELERFHDYVEAGAAITDCIKRNDHESLVEEYQRARRFAEEARALAVQLGGQTARPPTDEQLQQIVVAARMWHDVEEQIQAYKRDVWRKLTSAHGPMVASMVATRSGGGNMGSFGYSTAGVRGSGQGGSRDQHMELIGLLLELGVDDNPIWVWLLSRYDYLKGKIQATCEHAKVEIEVMRRRLAEAEKPSPAAIASHLRALGRGTIEAKIASLDAPDVIEMWDKVLAFAAGLLSAQGILGEVVEFWQTVAGFVDGRTQTSLPTGFRGESLHHHRLAPGSAADLHKGALELVDLVREQVYGFFAGPPPEDVSLLFSPVPPSPRTPVPSSSVPASPVTPLQRLRFGAPYQPQQQNMPPPPSHNGEAWEKFAFWPPWSNSVSGVHYLSEMLALVGAGATEMATVGTGIESDGIATDTADVDRLRTLVGAVRERCATALCAAWNRDAENVKYLEDWHRAADRRDVTKMPAAFAAFEGAVLSGMQKILYVSEAMAKPGAGDIVLPPSAKLLQMVRAQYVTTLYKALSGMVENAERPLKKADDDWTTTDGDGPGTSYVAVTAATTIAATGPLADSRVAAILDSGAFNAGDRNVRMLLTLSNLQSLRSEVVPRLNTQFENAFSVKLTDETKTIRDVLGQIDTRLFLSYTRPSVDALRRIVRAGVLDSKSGGGSGGTKPSEARPYVYEVLLLLVLVHSQVSTTADSLTQQVLSHLLEQTSRELLEALKQQTAAGVRYDLAGLMQATLDVEFIAQALSQYTTERASELQGLIYQELDGRTDNDARARLQSELPEMRSVLKRLREASKNEFACFRKPKRAGASGSGGTSGRGSPNTSVT
ncbi:exocyst complex component [Grosmannia clavigera kw1407]|uniref:Exocyst complex component SEC5 n=1 Tax=Grosmannia clavigera (strain kw1407 / UAMH 11150) TaxID=655863 RepID=F0XI25_GROCL|nr:exocyst complex component [Grosmannia clavigera kw1407]EFX02865.1 exocyst complex component [Grosmannia clavigera kw1407]